MDERDELLLQDVCREPGCYYAPMKGYVLCVACMHGLPHRAEHESVLAKKRWERRQKRDAKDRETD